VAVQVERASHPASDWAAYLTHFGLREPPFAITPDPRYLLMAERHREALALLLYGIGAAGGLVQLTGEVGTGKTTLCRALLERVPPHVDVALVLNPMLTATELLATVCDELRIAYPPGTASVKVLVDALSRHLLEAHAAGRRTVLVIDEAQNLAAEVLEQLRLLTNLETARDKLLHIILIGQPELAKLLERKDLRQVAQRVTARYHLTPFSEAETRACVVHRLQVAGQSAPIFTEGALREVHRHSRGVPRLVNVICDRALLGAFAHDRLQIDRAMVRTAAREVAGGSGRPVLSRRGVWAGALVAGVAAAVTAAALLVPGRLGDLAGSRAGSRSGQAPAPSTPSPAGAEGPAPADTGAAPIETRADRGAGARPIEAPAASDAVETTGMPRAGTRSALGALLDGSAATGDSRAAFERLYARWGIELDGDRLGCEQARTYGLRCLARTGDWGRLRGFDLPAILELATPTGSRGYATVIALSGDRATLAVGDRQWQVATAELDPHWNGAFVLLWRPPALAAFSLGVGHTGHDVEILRERLALVDGQAAGAQARTLYDEALRQRVMAFQRSRSLLADGIVGEETLAHLVTATAGPTLPLLSAGAAPWEPAP
jgi:general secretion pathway protein A